MDMERYGDYSEYEEDRPKSKNPVVIVIKILIALVCFSVIGVLVFRIIFFSYYPKSVNSLYFNDTLTSYYEENGGKIEVKTQELRAKYDDPDVASFFCDNLFIIEGAGQLQLSIRFNESAIAYMESELGLSGLDSSDPELLSFKLASYDEVLGEISYHGETVSKVAYEHKLMYHYYKLVIDGVRFGGKNNPSWYRLDVFVKGSDKLFASVCIYENHSEYALFENYELTAEDKP